MKLDPMKKRTRDQLQHGIAGVTLLAFLLTQLVWPLPAFGRDTLRQQPSKENKSGLEELTEKLKKKEKSSSVHSAIRRSTVDSIWKMRENSRTPARELVPKFPPKTTNPAPQVAAGMEEDDGIPKGIMEKLIRSYGKEQAAVIVHEVRESVLSLGEPLSEKRTRQIAHRIEPLTPWVIFKKDDPTSIPETPTPVRKIALLGNVLFPAVALIQGSLIPLIGWALFNLVVLVYTGINYYFLMEEGPYGVVTDKGLKKVILIKKRSGDQTQTRKAVSKAVYISLHPKHPDYVAEAFAMLRLIEEKVILSNPVYSVMLSSWANKKLVGEDRETPEFLLRFIDNLPDWFFSDYQSRDLRHRADKWYVDALAWLGRKRLQPGEYRRTLHSDACGVILAQLLYVLHGKNVQRTYRTLLQIGEGDPITEPFEGIAVPIYVGFDQGIAERIRDLLFENRNPGEAVKLLMRQPHHLVSEYMDFIQESQHAQPLQGRPDTAELSERFLSLVVTQPERMESEGHDTQRPAAAVPHDERIGETGSLEERLAEVRSNPDYERVVESALKEQSFAPLYQWAVNLERSLGLVGMERLLAEIEGAIPAPYDDDVPSPSELNDMVFGLYLSAAIQVQAERGYLDNAKRLVELAIAWATPDEALQRDAHYSYEDEEWRRVRPRAAMVSRVLDPGIRTWLGFSAGTADLSQMLDRRVTEYSGWISGVSPELFTRSAEAVRLEKEFADLAEKLQDSEGLFTLRTQTHGSHPPSIPELAESYLFLNEKVGRADLQNYVSHLSSALLRDVNLGQSTAGLEEQRQTIRSRMQESLGALGKQAPQGTAPVIIGPLLQEMDSRSRFLAGLEEQGIYLYDREDKVSLISRIITNHPEARLLRFAGLEEETRELLPLASYVGMTIEARWPPNGLLSLISQMTGLEETFLKTQADFQEFQAALEALSSGA